MIMRDEVSLKDIFEAINDLRIEVRNTYATKDELAPVRAIAYGLVGLVLTTIFYAVLSGTVKAF